MVSLNGNHDVKPEKYLQDGITTSEENKSRSWNKI